MRCNLMHTVTDGFLCAYHSLLMLLLDLFLEVRRTLDDGVADVVSLLGKSRLHLSQNIHGDEGYSTRLRTLVKCPCHARESLYH